MINFILLQRVPFPNYKEGKNTIRNSLAPHEYTTKLRDSGYTNNIATCDKTGWVPHQSFHSDSIRTEYRININPYKDVHYTGPLHSTGKLKKKEVVYKHT